MSSAKPPPPRTTSGPETWTSGPSIWARQAARTGSRVALASAGGRPAPEAERVLGRLDDRLPPGAAAQVGAQPGLDVAARTRCDAPGPALERGQTHDDARRAEATLAGAAGRRTRRPSAARTSSGTPSIVVTWRPAIAAHRRDAGDARCAVDPHGAAPALSLRAAAVLRPSGSRAPRAARRAARRRR